MLDESLRLYLKAKQVQEGLQFELTAVKREFDEKNAELIRGLEDASKLVIETRTNLEKEALEEFSKTGELTVHPAITIRRNPSIEYDHEEMQAWARQHAPHACVLNKPSLNELIKNSSIDSSAPYRIVFSQVVMVNTKTARRVLTQE